MTTAAFPLINGVRHSWASVEANVAGQIYYLTSINYSRKRTRNMVMVNHPDPVGKTMGNNEYSADGEFLLVESNNLQSALVAQSLQNGGNGGYGNVYFTIVVSFTENGLDTVTDTIIGCTLDSTESSNSQGNDPTKRKHEFNPVKILFNGVDDLDVPLTAPPGT
jgi:hypothetical protein